MAGPCWRYALSVFVLCFQATHSGDCDIGMEGMLLALFYSAGPERLHGGGCIWERWGCVGFTLLHGGRITYLGDPVELSFGGCVIDRESVSASREGLVGLYCSFSEVGDLLWCS